MGFVLSLIYIAFSLPKGESRNQPINQNGSVISGHASVFLKGNQDVPSSYQKPQEARSHSYTAPAVQVEIADFGEAGTLARFTYEPGFHYAEHVTPQIGTAFEEVPAHMTLVLSGRLHSVLPDGTDQETGPDDTWAFAALAWSTTRCMGGG